MKATKIKNRADSLANRLHRLLGRATAPAMGAIVTLTTISFTETAKAVRPYAGWHQRSQYSDEFNGSIKGNLWNRRTMTFNGRNGGRTVRMYGWMADNATVGGRQCMRVKASSYGTVDKGARLDSYTTNFKTGWYEAATKLGALNRFYWPTWWLHNDPVNGGSSDELDIMEYAYGDFGITHWRHSRNSSGAQTSNAQQRRLWHPSNSSHASFMQSNLVNKFSLWSVRVNSNGWTQFFKDNSSIVSGSSFVNYGMRMIFSSSPNRNLSDTPKNYTFPNFYIDYVRVFIPDGYMP